MATAIDDDTKRTVAEGRATIGSLVRSARDDLRKAFLVFVAGFLGTFYALRIFVWDQLKADLNANPDIEIVAVTPFDVILLQAKIGMAVGILMALPVVVYYGRDALRARGYWPAEDVARWKLVFPAVLSVVLFTVGIAYAYYVFFPIMLGFLAGNAVNAGFQPSWSIVKWTQFIAFLGMSFGLAAQLPLAMSSMSYLRIVSYEAFRDRWRYAVLAIFAFGAVFSPPDPFTQIMWALPLVLLYWVSLGVTKLVVMGQRAGEHVPIGRVVRERWNLLAGTLVLGGGATYAALTSGGLSAANEALRIIGSSRRFPTADELGLFGLSPAATAAVYAALVAVIAGLGALFYFRIQALEAQSIREAAAAGPAPASTGGPAEIDLDALSAAAVRAAPPEAFADLSEGEALEHARTAMDEGEADKAELILERYDEAQAELAEREAEGDDGDGAPTDDEGNVVTSTVAGMADAFSEDETTEEDIGGYYYDLAFILESLTSKAIWLVGTFIVVMAATFVYLYSGGIGDIRDSFLTHMPAGLVPDVEIVTLHPVEALVFEVKFSVLLGAVAILPLLLYFAWPSLEERGIVGGDRNVLAVWGGTVLVALTAGSLAGFFYVAPTIISWLAADALSSSMVIAYRINNFGWLVILTTVGIGVLAEIPLTMLLFHRGGIVSYGTMRRRWRVFVVGVFALGGLFTPKGVFTMFIVAIPAAFAYGLGLGLLWLFTRVSGAVSRPPRGAAD